MVVKPEITYRTVKSRMKARKSVRIPAMSPGFGKQLSSMVAKQQGDWHIGSTKDCVLFAFSWHCGTVISYIKLIKIIKGAPTSGHKRFNRFDELAGL